jgi:hypothetical protein
MHGLFSGLMIASAVSIMIYVAYSYVVAPKQVVVTPIVTVPGATIEGNTVVAPVGTPAAADALDPNVPTVQPSAPVVRETTVWEKLASATKKSITLFIQLVMSAALLLGNGILQMGDFFNAPEVRDWVNANFTPAKATGIIALLLLLNTFARLRTMFKST